MAPGVPGNEACYRPTREAVVHRGTGRYFALAVAALALLLVISFSVGRYPVSANELLRLLWFKVSGRRVVCPRPSRL